MSETTEKIEKYKDSVSHAHHYAVEVCYRLRPALQDDTLSESELCDVGFMLRECEKLLDEARKEVKSKKEMISKMLAVKITKSYMEDPSREMRAKGTMATATPDVNIRPKLPKAGTPEYVTLLAWLGVPDSAIEGGTLSIHFNRMSEMLTRMAEEGKNPPPGLVGTYTDANCVFRRTNNSKTKD